MRRVRWRFKVIDMDMERMMNRCKERGFYEPYVIFSNGETDYITVYEYENGMNGYKKIGNIKIINSEIGK